MFCRMISCVLYVGGEELGKVSFRSAVVWR